MCGDDGMVAISDEHQIAIDESQGVVARSRGVVQALECISFGFADPVVVGFVEVHLEGRIVDVMLVGRIARPISAGRINLADQELIGGKLRTNDIDNLTSAVSAAANLLAAIRWSYDSRTEPGGRGSSAVREFAGSDRGNLKRRAARQIYGVRVAAENVLPSSNVSWPFAPVDRRFSSEEDQSGFLVSSAALPILSSNQPAHGEADRLPVCPLPCDRDEDTGFVLWDGIRVNQYLLRVTSFCHVNLPGKSVPIASKSVTFDQPVIRVVSRHQK
jgi:hypothetical protein